jgi:hypothetical protein
LARKGLEEVLTDDGGQRQHRLRRSGGYIGLQGGPTTPREKDDGAGHLKSQGVWVEVVLTRERKVAMSWSKSGEVAVCRRPRVNNRRKVDVGGGLKVSWVVGLT